MVNFATNIKTTHICQFKMLLLLSSFFAKLSQILATLQGWVAMLIILITNLFINYIAGFEMNLTIVTLMVLIDAIWGIVRSIKQGKFATSELARDTFSKLLVYATLMLVFIGIDKMLSWEKNWSCDMISAMVCLVECYSIMGNMLIVYPKMPILKIFKKFVKGEIASKLNIDAEDIDEYLKEQDNDNKRKGEGSN